MSGHVSHVALVRRHIGGSCEARKTVVKEKYAQRLHARHEYINTEVELEAVDEEGLADVAL